MTVDAEAQRRELAGLGVPDGEIDKIIAVSAKREMFEVWPENLESLNVFLACEAKWVWLVGFNAATRTELSWDAVKTACWALEVKQPRRVFNDVRAMEQAALEEFNEVLNG